MDNEKVQIVDIGTDVPENEIEDYTNFLKIVLECSKVEIHTYKLGYIILYCFGNPRKIQIKMTELNMTGTWKLILL
jgi:hypothetical protein